MKQTSDLLSLSPLRHSDGFASCKARCVLISASLPKAPFPVKGCVCLVGFASLQSPLAYSPGIHAGAERGATAPRPSKDACSQPFVPLHDAVAQMADDLYGGYAPSTIFINDRDFSIVCNFVFMLLALL